jgi:murein DD-endopeptidase MepM/ murein hydrolase activator NlpD
MKHIIQKTLAIVGFIALFGAFDDPIAPQSTVSNTPQYPTNYFQSPTIGPLALSGTFGELRANHFHSGIDIKPTRRGSNEPLFAAAEGYVARIRIQEGGYGQALYIAHPNGYTTVYGHLDKFAPDIQAFMRQKQYEKQQFEVDLVLQPHELPVRQGQNIGNMGNRGHSFGQHLHFEIRETKTERAINPLLFGFGMPDNRPPTMNGLKVYLLDDKKEVVGTRYINLVKKSATEYGIAGDTLDVNAPNVAFGLRTNDAHGDDSGENGIFSLDLACDDVPIYNFKAETFGFDETRYINAHLDYYEQQHRRTWFHRAFVLPNNRLSMYQNVQNQGITPLSITDNLGKKMTFIAKDAAGNATTLRFVARPKEPTTLAPPKTYNYLLPCAKESLVKLNGEDATFYFPNTAFYEDAYVNFNTSTTEVGYFSPTFYLHNPLTPIHSSIEIAIKPINLPEEMRAKAFIAYCQSDDGRTYSCGGKWATDGSLRTQNNRFGNYSIQLDTEKPRISAVSFQADMRKLSRLSFKIKDNRETMGNARPLRYRAELDGNWLLMEMDGKYDLLFHKFEEGYISEGTHTFKLVVTDDRDNEAVFEGTFRR